MTGELLGFAAGLGLLAVGGELAVEAAMGLSKGEADRTIEEMDRILEEVDSLLGPNDRSDTPV